MTTRAATIQIEDKPRLWGIWILFWLVYAICLYGWIRPEMIFTAFGRLLPYPNFEWTRDYAIRSLNHSGGIAEYLGGLLSQGFSEPWTATILITAVAMAVSMGIGFPCYSMGGGAWALGVYVPALMILMACAQFSHPMTSCLSLSAAVWAFALIRRVRFRTIWLEWAIFAMAAAGVYWIAGGGVWVFSLLLVMEAMRHKALTSGLVKFGLTAGIAWGLGMGMQDWPAARALLYPMPFGPGWSLNIRNVPLTAIQIVWIWPIAIGLMVFLLDRFRSGRSPASRSRTNPPHRSWSIALVQGLLWVTAVPLSAYLAVDPISARQLRIIHLGRHQRWAQLLDCAGKLSPEGYNLYLTFEIDRALAHTGQMGERMFVYPQTPQGLLLTAPTEVGQPEPTYNIDLMIELGCINLAEHAAMELLEVKGNLPFVLEWLAKIYSVKDSPETVRVFLNRLAVIPSHRSRARQMLKRLDADPGFQRDEEICRLRQCNPQKDLVTFDLVPEGLFDYLLERNPSNRIAWDYRMAIYLLTQQVDKVAAHLNELERFGHTTLPRHYAEALAIHRIRGGQAFPLGRFEPPRSIEERARSFLATYNNLRADRPLAMKTLAKEYGDSYFYYYTFGVSGVKE